MDVHERIVGIAWLLAAPCSIWAFLYYLATCRRISLTPLRPWLIGGCVAAMPGSLFFMASNHAGTAIVFNTICSFIAGVLGWINRRAFSAMSGA